MISRYTCRTINKHACSPNRQKDRQETEVKIKFNGKILSLTENIAKIYSLTHTVLCIVVIAMEVK